MKIDVNTFISKLMTELEKEETKQGKSKLLRDSYFTIFRDYLNAVAQMRKFQKRFFKYKDAASLQDAKKYERMVDTMMNDLLEEKRSPRMF